MPTVDTPITDAQAIYRELEKGLGHELVNDNNVEGLIQLARQHGNQLLETTLDEWRSSCG